MESTLYNLRFEVRKSVRYHDYRRNFYLKAHSWVSFWSIVLGSAAVRCGVQGVGLGVAFVGRPLRP